MARLDSSVSFYIKKCRTLRLTEPRYILLELTTRNVILGNLMKFNL